MERLRGNMIIFRYQLRHIGMGKHRMNEHIQAASRKRYFGVLLILLGVALGIVSRTAGGSPSQDFTSGILMGLSAGILLVGILAVLLSFIRRR